MSRKSPILISHHMLEVLCWFNVLYAFCTKICTSSRIKSWKYTNNVSYGLEFVYRAPIYFWPHFMRVFALYMFECIVNGDFLSLFFRKGWHKCVLLCHHHFQYHFCFRQLYYHPEFVEAFQRIESFLGKD
jgi:hypothetical protein